MVEHVDVYMPVEDPSMFTNGFIRSSNPGAKMVVGDFSEEELDRTCDEWVRLVEERGKKAKGVAIVGSGRK